MGGRRLLHVLPREYTQNLYLAPSVASDGESNELEQDAEQNTDMAPACQVELRPADRFRLICDPALGRRRILPFNGNVMGIGYDNAGNLRMSWKRTYNFLEQIPRPERKSRCELSLRRGRIGNETVFFLEITMIPILRGPTVYRERHTKRHSFTLPLYYDPGTRVVMPGNENRSLREAVPRLFVDGEGDSEMAN